MFLRGYTQILVPTLILKFYRADCMYCSTGISSESRNSAKYKKNSEKIPTSAEFQKSTSVHTLVTCYLMTRSDSRQVGVW
jgi:hypothetical protein